MNYTQYLTICFWFKYRAERRDQLARTALLFLCRGYAMPSPPPPGFAAHPEILRVPIRRLKRWATRAIRETVPVCKIGGVSGRVKGPRLALIRSQRLYS